jgi:LmbE family N-acetylglucosaminyl deacetylase
MEVIFVNMVVNPDINAHSKAAVIVAHPDDETLWAGGTILIHASWTWYIAAICRASDPDRAPRFHRALQALGAAGTLADLDDGPDQLPLDPSAVQASIAGMLPPDDFDLVITHDPAGEYTRHLRHEEVARAVIELWQAGRIRATELWTFAYEDGKKQYLPRPVEDAAIHAGLPESIWERKYSIITDIYGFPSDGFEARTTPRSEAFRRFKDPAEASRWAELRGGRA